MKRSTGTFRASRHGDEVVRAFVPAPLPPADPPLELSEDQANLLAETVAALGRLSVAGSLVPGESWFVYGFVRREAVLTSEIEGTQATLQDVLTYEATGEADRPDDVREVCNYVDALEYARREVARPRGLPLSVRLLCTAHKRLMRGVRGANKQPGELRRSQNWIGGTRPGDARFVPPPPELVDDCLGSLERWIHSADPLHPVVRAGLAHVQFETIHPFLDGNGRIGRLLIALLLEHWDVLQSPLLCVSLAFRRRQREYYDRLTAVRIEGDWEGWITFYLQCVREAAEDGARRAQALVALMLADRKRLVEGEGLTLGAVRLLEILPTRPVVTLALVTSELGVSKPTAAAALETLASAGILVETTGRKRDRVYAYRAYLRALVDPGDRGSPG